MTIKKPSRKQIIIPINKDNSKIITSQANNYVLKINRPLKGIKSKISANFICYDNKKIIITTNKAMATLDLNIVKKYIKILNNINSNDVICSQLPQSKLYLQILELSYYIGNLDFPIISNVVEKIIKNTHIFNDVALTSHLHIIKASFRLDMAVI